MDTANCASWSPVEVKQVSEQSFSDQVSKQVLGQVSMQQVSDQVSKQVSDQVSEQQVSGVSHSTLLISLH